MSSSRHSCSTCLYHQTFLMSLTAAIQYIKSTPVQQISVCLVICHIIMVDWNMQLCLLWLNPFVNEMGCKLLSCKLDKAVLNKDYLWCIIHAESVLPFKMVLIRALYWICKTLKHMQIMDSGICVLDIYCEWCCDSTVTETLRIFPSSNLCSREAAVYCKMEIIQWNIHPHRRTKQLVCTE